MLFVLIALWGVGIVLLVLEPRKSSVRWLSGVAFCGGSGALSAVIGDTIMPYAEARQVEPSMLQLMDAARMLFSLLQYYGLPYTFLLFAFSFNPAGVTPERKKLLAALLLLPAALTLLIVRPIHPIQFRLTAAWAIPYIGIAALWILMKKETHFMLRRNDRVTTLAIVPTVLLSAVMNYVLPSFGFYEMWRYNTWFIAIAIIIFLVAIFNYGFLGIRFLIQTRRLDASIRAVTSGTAMLNHAIKNDVGKMKLFGEKIRAYAEQTNQQELAADIEVILSSSRHIREMIARVQDQSQDLVLKKGWHDPGPLLEALSDQLLAGAPHVQIDLAIDPGCRIYCDRAQTVEVWNNVLTNAIEAMPGGGGIQVRVYEQKGYTVTEMKDTGPGMDKKLQRQAMEPFFTTKTERRMNFGLGLSYCYQVMKKHGGSFDLISEPGKGTNVIMRFPIPRMRQKERG